MYEYMILMMSKKNQTRLLQSISIASRLIQGCFNKQSLASKLTQDQPLPQNKVFLRHPRLWWSITRQCNRLPENNFEKELLKRVLNLNFEPVIDY